MPGVGWLPAAVQRHRDVRGVGGWQIGLYTILASPIVYGKYCNTQYKIVVGVEHDINMILRNSVGDEGGGVGCSIKGGVGDYIN